MILSMLDTNYLKKQSILYIIITIICMIFSFIYELNSHHVYSFYMIFAFIFPLLSFLLSIYLYKKYKKINRIGINLYNSSIACFTLYFYIMGFLKIYGTTNSKVYVYLILGTLLFILAMIYLTRGENNE